MAVYLEATLRFAGLSSNVSINDIVPSRKVGLAAQGDVESPARTRSSDDIGVSWISVSSSLFESYDESEILIQAASLVLQVLNRDTLSDC
jgi:hypothetical protein